MGKVIFVILALFLFFGAFREPIIDGITGWRTNDTTDTPIVTTGANQTSANVTLSYDLYQAALAEVYSITSSNNTDTPAASNYTASTRLLTVGGLIPSITRTLTINYLAETDDTVMRVMGPFLVILIFGFVCYIIVRHAQSKRG